LKTGVFTAREVECRTESMYTAYSHTLLIEAETCVMIVNKMIAVALAQVRAQAFGALIERVVCVGFPLVWAWSNWPA
jgi:glutamine synthetase type III